MNKEQNFISSVVYLNNMNTDSILFLQTIYDCMDEHFLHFEIIVVTDENYQENPSSIQNWAKKIQKPLTIIQLSEGQHPEQCMNAGLDLTIGDYVYEFDTSIMTYPKELIWKAYETIMKGNDIVTVCPMREKISSRLFYKVFNNHSGATLRTNVFRLVSRRAINRAHSMNENLPYRKAAYAACGLNTEVLEFSGEGNKNTNIMARSELAIDSLILYTDFSYRFSLGFSMLMLVGTVAMMIYTFAIYLTGNPINGWTTTMLALTAGLTGLFAILTMVLKYLSLILKLIFQKQSYMIKNIDKL